MDLESECGCGEGDEVAGCPRGESDEGIPIVSQSHVEDASSLTHAHVDMIDTEDA